MHDCTMVFLWYELSILNHLQDIPHRRHDVTWRDMTWCDMAWHDVTWMSRHVMSCHVTSCHVKSCHVTSRHVMSRHVMSCYVRDVTWLDVTWRYVTWHDVTWHDVTWHNMTWHDVTWRDVTWHHMMWHYIAVIFWQEQLWDCFSLFIANFVEPMMWMFWQAMHHVISYPVTPTPCRNDAKSSNSRINYVLHVILFTQSSL